MSPKRLIQAAILSFGFVSSSLLMGTEAAAGGAPQVPPRNFTVGVTTDTFVDPHRTTPAWNQKLPSVADSGPS